MNTPLPTVLAAALALTGCAAPAVTVQQDCQPINRYDTRCDPTTTTTTAPSVRPITLTGPHTVVYELAGHGTAQVVQVTTDASNTGHFGEDQMGDAAAPWRLVVAAPAGMTPLLRMQPTDEVRCRISIDGQDVTGEFPKSNMAGNGALTVCGATREP